VVGKTGRKIPITPRITESVPAMMNRYLFSLSGILYYEKKVEKFISSKVRINLCLGIRREKIS